MVIMFLLYFLVGVLVLLSLKAGALFLPIYYVRAKAHGASMPPVQYSFAFGIFRLVTSLKRMREGTLFKFLDEVKTPGRTMLDQAAFRWMLVTTEPENIKAILATKFKDFNLGPRDLTIGYSFGKGIFVLNGEPWKHSRALLRPQFTRDQISQLDSIIDHSEKLFQALETVQKRQPFVDCQDMFHKFTLDTSTEFLFGQSLESLQRVIGGTPTRVTSNGRTVTAEQFVESYNYLVVGAGKRMIFGPLRNLVSGKEYTEHIERSRILIDYFVKIALDATEGQDEKHTDEKYVFSHGLARATRDPIVLRDQIFNILIAGRDTTASTLTFIIYWMVTNPDIYEKLREEVLSEFGTAQENRTVTFEMLRSARFVNAVINETLRLAPVVPLNGRWAIRDTTLPTGGGPNQNKPVFVPKGTLIGYRTYLVHRDKDIWGEDANEFKPDRWLKKQDVPSWAYIPFNGGPRICIGQQFALTELAFVIVRIAQRYSRIIGDLPDAPTFEASLTLRSRSPVDVRFEK